MLQEISLDSHQYKGAKRRAFEDGKVKLNMTMYDVKAVEENKHEIIE